MAGRQADSGGAEQGGSEKAGSLEQLRVRIDDLDRRLVSMLNERARLVVEVGALKRQEGGPIYAPHREADVLSRVVSASEGPLPARTIEAVYRELMSGSFSLERPIRIGYLGPQGSWSHVAATKQFGSSVEYDDLRAIGGVFEEIRRGHVDYGLVPIENSLGGGIMETLEAFKLHAHEVSIYAEVQIEIHHALLANCEPSKVRRIHSKPEVFAQCRTWLATQYPHAELIPSASSSRAVLTAAEEYRQAEAISAEATSAAIGSELAGEIYGVRVLFDDIADNVSNITRFFVVSREEAKPSGDDKTSVMFTTPDEPGALVRVLQAFERHGVNLTHIDKRPSGRENWTYTFFVDARGHQEDESMSRALADARAHCQELIVLGSYPRSKRFL